MIYERKARQVIRELLIAGEEKGAKVVKIFCADENELLIEWRASKCNFAQSLPVLVNTVFEVDSCHILFGQSNWVSFGGVSIVLEYDRRPEEIISDYSDNDFCSAIAERADGVAYV